MCLLLQCAMDPTSLGFLRKVHNLKLMRKHLEKKRKRGTFYKLAHNLQKCMKNKTEKFFQIKGDNRDVTTTCN